MSRSKNLWPKLATYRSKLYSCQESFRSRNNYRTLLKSSILSFILIITYSISLGQPGPSAPQEETYEEIEAVYDAYLNSLPDDSINHQAKTYMRFKAFWSDRVGNGDGNTKGSFSSYFKAMIDYEIYNCDGLSENQNEWELLGPVNYQFHAMGIVKSVWMHPTNHDTIFAGTRSSGLWRSIDGGNNWNNVIDDLNLIGTGIFDITGVPDSPLMFAVTGIMGGVTDGIYGTGLLRSTNNGSTWAIMSGLANELHNDGLDPFKTAITSVCINPSYNQYVFAGTKNKIYKSSDAGFTWNGNSSPVTNPANGQHFTEIEYSPNQISVFAASKNSNGIGGGAELWRSNNGSNWENLTGAFYSQTSQNYIKEIEVDVLDSNIVFARVLYSSGNNPTYIYKSTDNGDSFIDLEITYPEAPYQSLETIHSTSRSGFEVYDPENNKFFIGSNYLHKYNGTAFTNTYANYPTVTHVDVRDV